MRVSTTTATMPADAGHVLAFAELVARHPAGHRLWQGQGTVLDPVAAVTAVAGAGVRVPTGFGVLTTPRRHPEDAAVAAYTVASVTGHETVYGLGPASPPEQRRLLGTEIDRPLRHVGDYVQRLRSALDSHPLASTGLPAPRIGLGVLRERMAFLAGRLADAALTWLCPPEHLRSVLVPAIWAGAREAGHRRPAVIAYVPVVVDRPGRDPERYCEAAVSGHLRLPHYAEAARSAGIDVDDASRWARSFLDAGGALTGTPDRIARDLDVYREAGVDEIVLHQPATATLDGPAAALADTEAVFDAVARLHEGSR